MSPRLPTKVALLALLLPALLVAPACDRSGSPGTREPGGGEQGMRLEYPVTPFKLKSNVTLSLEFGGLQVGSAKLSGTATIEGKPTGGKIETTGTIDTVDAFELGGDLKPKEGEPAPDPNAVVGRAFGRVIGLDGEEDEEASKSLPVNGSKGEQTPQAAMIEQVARALIAVPELPSVGLVQGKPVKKSETKERQLGPLKIPVDSDSTYTLEKIDTSGGTRVATIRVAGEGSGAAEMQGQLVSLDESGEGVLVFDLDKKLPLSWKATQTVGYSFSQGSVEQIVTIDSTFEPL